jgi:hypothetical protein
LQQRAMRVRYAQHDGIDLMITNPIVQPKVAIVASLLIGALTLAAFLLRPDTGRQPAEQSGFGHRDASSAAGPEGPLSTALASGKVAAQSQSDADVAVVLDAVRTSLKRDDLASARVLLGAEQALYANDPRVVALQRELQAREEAGGHGMAVEPTVAGSVPPPASSRSSRYVARYAARAERVHGASSRSRERAGSPVEYAGSGHVLPTEAVSDPGMRRSAPSVVPANPETDSTALRVVPSAAATSSSSSSSSSQSGALPPPLTQASQNNPSAQTVQSAPSAQPDSTTTTPAPPGASTQAPKTRAQVRMEVEQARADGALPRFGNPDPAGPGGAPSRISHAVVLDW